MNRTIRQILQSCVAGWMFFAGLGAGASAAEPFTVVVLPDTQNYVKSDGAEKKFFAQTGWIKDNLGKLNIRAGAA